MRIANVLDVAGEGEAAKAIREWKPGDLGVHIILKKKLEMVPMGFADYREDMETYRKWLKREFNLDIQDQKAAHGVQPVMVPNIDPAKPGTEHNFKGPKLDDKSRDLILKKGISRMDTSYEFA